MGLTVRAKTQPLIHYGPKPVGSTETMVQEGMRLTQERYLVGQSTTNDLLDAHTALVKAEGNRTQLRWDYYIALADFKR